ncbi:MAG: reverse gyrase [Archaeoglobaceae archaeon]
MEVIYANLCPVCGGDLSHREISSGVCEDEHRPLCRMKEDGDVEEFFRFFKRCLNSEPRAVQRMWARRILRGESFAATAPTGVGKTSFGLVMSLFLACKKKRSYLILPTSLLVKQCVENLKKFASNAGIELGVNEVKGVSVGYYHGKIARDEKENFFSNIRNFDILITTTQFLSRHFDEIRGEIYDFVFVDDVDAVLKASKNVDRILQLLGFRWERGWKGEAKGVLVVSTATAKKGKKAELFRKLLNFDVGSSRLTVRNIEDITVNDESMEIVEQIMRRLGGGGLIYARTSEEAEKIFEALKERWKVGIATSGRSGDVDRFARGELDFLVGTAYYYGTLVRGLDLPERIRYAIFVGCPVFRVRVEDVDSASPGVLRVLALLCRDKPEIEPFLAKLNQLETDEELQMQLREVLKPLIERGEISARDVVVRKGEILFPDVRTYIQGSGRTSRLFAGGITKGASFLLEDDEEVLRAFIERAKYFDIEFKSIEDVDFEALRRELDETREKFKRRGEFELIRPALFIVESPTKAKQISRFFGKPSVKVVDGAVIYEIPMEKFVLLVTASLGHITDLITNRAFHGVEVNEVFVPIYASIKRCRNCGYQFTEERKECPKCGSEDVDDSKKRIEALRKFAHDAEFVIIGTDPDAEGEKIAWDLKNLLAGCGTIKRAEFHEVTRRAILEALESLRDVDENLVKAQVVRRIEDRWIGFVLSQKLWDKFSNRNLSAGRAQTPVLGWVIQRYNESREKRSVAVIRDLDLTLEHDKKEFEVEVRLLEEREEERVPLPPYTTDAMLRDAAAILKMSAKEAMQVAQELFESGLITYHRTDSTRVSEVGLRIARDYLGEDFVAREWFSEGAHECIRPTRSVDRDTLQRLIHEGVIQVEGLSWRHFALYDLIFRRFMASQCKPFKVVVKVYEIKYDGKSVREERIVAASGRAYELYRSVWVRKELPVGRFTVEAEIRKVPKVPLLSQSDVVQLMKERGIGRPSTYATIVDRLFMRNYVIEKGGKLIPTKLGINVYEYLSRNYGKFVSELRTRMLEEKMDAIERGELDYYEALRELYEEIKEIEIA